MFFLVKLLEFSTKKIARQEAQAETKCLKASYFLGGRYARALRCRHSCIMSIFAELIMDMMKAINAIAVGRLSPLSIRRTIPMTARSSFKRNLMSPIDILLPFHEESSAQS